MRSDDILARADEALGRIGGAPASPHVNRTVQIGIIIGVVLVLWTLLTAPFLLIFLALAALGGGLLLIARKPVTNAAKPPAEDLPKVPLATLPHKSELWLASQRRLLPAAAQSISDSICSRLKILAGQIATMVDTDPMAYDIRRLLAQELPDLIQDYHKVPAALRKVAVNAIMPDQQLAKGLGVIDSQLEHLNTRIASGPVSDLATQARYLDLKYQDVQE